LLFAAGGSSAAPLYGCEAGAGLTENAPANPHSTRVLSWNQLLNSELYDNDREKLEQVNRFFNQFGFVSDRAQWGRQDYWATPHELLKSGLGDCEDIALSKYISLRCLGVSVQRLRLTYTFALTLNKAHMVLVFLDNLTSDIRPASSRRDLVPVYSFNDDSLWLNRQHGEDERIGDSSRIKAWNELRARIRADAGAP
jgi:predicted transglutaminase-like cysteine proteinase